MFVSAGTYRASGNSADISQYNFIQLYRTDRDSLNSYAVTGMEIFRKARIFYVREVRDFRIGDNITDCKVGQIKFEYFDNI